MNTLATLSLGAVLTFGPATLMFGQQGAPPPEKTANPQGATTTRSATAGSANTQGMVDNNMKSNNEAPPAAPELRRSAGTAGHSDNTARDQKRRTGRGNAKGSAGRRSNRNSGSNSEDEKRR